MIRTRKKSIRDDIDESWLIDNENRNVELSELIIAAELNDLNSLIDDSIAIRRYCEISAVRLTEKQNRNVELSELIKTTNLNDLNLIDLNFSIDLIDDLIKLYLFAFVNDVSTRIFLLIWSMSAATKYFDFDESIETRILILCWISKLNVFVDLINDVKFVSNAICEILASWLIEKQTRDVELSLLLKLLNLKFLNDLNDLNNLIDDSIAIRRYCEVSAVRLTEK